jgi:hypothetical protein
MKAPYRVYNNKNGGQTFFEADGDGWFCTHGAWYGAPITVKGKPALEHSCGVSVYDSYQDLTTQEYKEMY